MCELEEVRQRLGDEQARAELLLHVDLQPVERLGIADGDELGRVGVEPRPEIADRVDLEVLEVGVRARFTCDPGHVELVVDVAVEVEVRVLDRGDRLERELARDRHMPQPPLAHRLRDDGALVADHRVVEPGLEHVRTHRAEHPPGDDDHVQTRVARAAECAPRALVEHGVLAHQRAVEIARERAHVPRKPHR